MDNNLKENGLNNIVKMYANLDYFDQYSGSVILFIIITLIVILLLSYFHTIINIQPIINDWPNQRCKPNIIPFAGLINPPEGVSASDYTTQNFNYCTQTVLASTTGSAVQPLSFITNTLNSINEHIKNRIQSIRGMFNKIRTSIRSVSDEIMGRLMNVMIPLIQMIIGFKDLGSKLQGTMTAGLYTLLGSYFTLQGLMGAIAQSLVTILAGLAVTIAALWLSPFTWGAAAANTAIYIAIAVPTSMILSFMSDSLHIKGYSIPQVKCFDKKTLIKMNDGTHKQIIHINVGDILFNDNKVTAKIKVEREGSIMYRLNNVIVSDSHIVKYADTWIKVSKHPKSIKYNLDYNEDFLYCLNTTKKIIEINDIIFTDWDEIYDDSLNTIINNNIIPLNNNTENIHKRLDYGFSPTTQIRLRNNKVVDIINLKINDILENGEIVYGTVEIDGLNIAEQFKYNLGKNNTLEGHAPIFEYNKEKIKKNHSKLYHILTNANHFIFNNTIIPDYNAGIDRFFHFIHF